MVGTGGFEPPTSCVSSKRSPPELRAYTFAGRPINVYMVNPKGPVVSRPKCFGPRGPRRPPAAPRGKPHGPCPMCSQEERTLGGSAPDRARDSTSNRGGIPDDPPVFQPLEGGGSYSILVTVGSRQQEIARWLATR